MTGVMANPKLKPRKSAPSTAKSVSPAASKKAAKATAAKENAPTSSEAAPRHRIFAMPFARVYPLYVKKVERKGRTKDEVDVIVLWLTGYTAEQLRTVIDEQVDFEAFFANAPRLNPNIALIKGVVCGVRVEEVQDPLMQKIRYLDKLIDELAKGKSMSSILRA